MKRAAALLFLAFAACGRGDKEVVATGPRLAEKVLVFALDGATWALMDPWMESGRLPNFARLVAEGTRADLGTLEPTVSPAIWTTIATGKLPSEHGITGFIGVPGLDMTTLPNTAMRRVKAFWNVLPDQGVTVGVLGWWVTWPAEAVGEGSYIVSDRVPYTRMEAAIDRETLTLEDTYPSDLIETLVPLVERPDAIAPDVVQRFLSMGPEEMERYVVGQGYEMGKPLVEFKYAYQSDRSTMKMALTLAEERPVDVLSVYLTGIDTVSHLFWHFTFPEGYDVPQPMVDLFGEVIPRYYEVVDRYLGDLLRELGPETAVVVVSDHGFASTGELPWSGGHVGLPGGPPPGVLLLAGPPFASGRRLDGVHVLDVLPTLLHLVGLPPAKDMPGKVVTEAFRSPGDLLPRLPSYEGVGTPRRAGDLPRDPDGDAARLERLRSLGYLD